ncbi:MAG: cell division protein SepF [Ruminococcaceae bacterium]|nr:cell division protein SepF [Oscillospiraceae bacterium]
MGLFESIKNILTIPEEDEYDEAIEEAVEKEEPKKKTVAQEPVRRSEPSARILGGGKSKTVNFNPNQMQVVLVKPERYDDVTSIADHLNEGKTVVLNLENLDTELCRRIVDFLSGATYANHGNMRKVSRGTFLIVPHGVDMMGELMLEDFEENKMYF